MRQKTNDCIDFYFSSTSIVRQMAKWRNRMNELVFTIWPLIKTLLNHVKFQTRRMSNLLAFSSFAFFLLLFNLEMVNFARSSYVNHYMKLIL